MHAARRIGGVDHQQFYLGQSGSSLQRRRSTVRATSFHSSTQTPWEGFYKSRGCRHLQSGQFKLFKKRQTVSTPHLWIWDSHSVRILLSSIPGELHLLNLCVVKLRISQEFPGGWPPYCTICGKNLLWNGLEKTQSVIFVFGSCFEKQFRHQQEGRKWKDLNKVTKINISNKAIQTFIYPVRNTVQDCVFLPIGSQLHSLSSGRGFKENVVVWNISLKKSKMYVFWGWIHSLSGTN